MVKALSLEHQPSENGAVTLCWSMMIGLGLGVAFFSWLHHFFPQVFEVPVNPVGLPFSSFPEKLLKDLGIIFFSALLFAHSLRSYGLYRSTMFFLGSFIFTGLQESIWILLGRIEVVAPTYYFTKGIFWFFETPVSACLGWYCLAYSWTYVAGYLLPSRTILARAALAGFLAMNLDLWADPLATHSKSRHWIWLSGEHLRIFNIPLTNFVGWFLLIFVFALLVEQIPAWLKKYGTEKSTLIFLGWCLAADVVLLFGIGSIRRLLGFLPITNLTWWGI